MMLHLNGALKPVFITCAEASTYTESIAGADMVGACAMCHGEESAGLTLNRRHGE